jgi:hypothetical protein
MFFAFAVQELKRGGSMMNINLFWEDKGYDPPRDSGVVSRRVPN